MDLSAIEISIGLITFDIYAIVGIVAPIAVAIVGMLIVWRNAVRVLREISNFK